MTRRLLVALVGAVALALAGAPSAFAQTPSPWWGLYSEVAPTHLPPGGNGTIVLVLGNLGASVIDGSGAHPVLLTDRLPPGLTPRSFTSPTVNWEEPRGGGGKCAIESQVVHCTYAGVLYPYEQLEVEVKVEVAADASSAEQGELSVTGGGASQASSVQRFTLSEQATPFGVQDYEVGLSGVDGTPATQAGSHPAQMTTTLVLDQEPSQGGGLGNRRPVALPKDLRFGLPPGLLGDPQAVQQCSLLDFDERIHGPDYCPPGSVVGVATATVREAKALGTITQTVPVFNLVPADGEPARLGFEVKGLVFVTIDTSVQAGGDYHVVASVERANQTAGILSSQVTLWGVPGASAHNPSRGWKCLAYGGEEQLKEAEEVEAGEGCPETTPAGEGETPFLISPTSCAQNPASEPLNFSLEMDSWTEPLTFPLAQPTAEYSWQDKAGHPLGFQGCETLAFEPSLQASPAVAGSPPVHTAATPTGLTVRVKVPQGPLLEPNPEGRAQADVRDTTVTLPEGVHLNPSAANGLQACTEAQAGFERINPTTGTQEFTAGPASCPEASKVANVHIKTPLLPKEVEGALYLAEPAPNGEPAKNPFNSLVALYLVAEDKEAGILVKLAGEGKLDQSTGRVSTSFQNTPQLPFEELKVELFGGPRASLSTPAFCGTYSTQASFTPWSGTAPVQVSSPAEEFDITEDCASAGPLGFSPLFAARSTNATAGAFSPFELQLERPDGQQALTGVSVTLPPGVAALLSTVNPCPEPPAGVEWSCGTESLIGHSLASSGVGSQPVTLPGDAYLTTGYDGAPFGLLVRTKAEAGPFDLGYVNVRSRINVNPETAAVTVTTNPGPHGDALITMLKGIPVQLKRLQVNVDRQGFEFNPTSCEPMSITGTLSGSEGAATNVSSRFQVGGCEGLPFHPSLEASTSGQASKANGASLTVKVTSAGLGQANIRKVFLTIPKILPSRLQPTLQHACPDVVFNANPAGCDEDSLIGSATVHTPVLKSPLTGPAYVVSHGNAAFPDVEFVLQGEGITLVLDGKTDIKGGVTYSRFESAPDAPFTTFETVLPEGPHSVLAVNTEEAPDYDLCTHKITIPTVITAQDGAVIEQTTKVATTGCGALTGYKAKFTNAQLLAKALKACKKDKRKANRVRCAKAAHKRYAPKRNARKAEKADRSTKRRGGRRG